jgi:hypothetical protein
MEIWEIEARECIRDLVVRYNANGDSGRFAEVGKLFADDAVMTLEGGVYTGLAEIMTIFTGTQSTLSSGGTAPTYLRHMTATHQIDVLSDNTARGRCYFQVLTSVGLDHWGRYIDEYRKVNDTWLFARRRVDVDGRNADSLFGAA